MRLTERQLIMSKIVLIDGHSILNRAFFGLPDLTNAERTPYECNIWIFKYYVQDSGGGKAGVSDRCI